MSKVNDNVQAQVVMLKGELQSTLTTLQTWVVESHSARKPHAIKLQQKQSQPPEEDRATRPAGLLCHGHPAADRPPVRCMSRCAHRRRRPG